MWTDEARAAAAEARRRKRKYMTVYHGTAAANIEAIRKRGIIPAKEHRINSPSLYHGVRSQSVFVTPDVKIAKSYAETMAAHRYIAAGLPLRAKKQFLFGDKRYPIGTDYIGRAEAAVVTLRVPTKLLKHDRNNMIKGMEYRIPGKLSPKHIRSVRRFRYTFHRTSGTKE